MDPPLPSRIVGGSSMRRLALPLAALIALTGLTVVTGGASPVQATDLPDAQQPGPATCFATMPKYTRGAVVASASAVIQTERMPSGSVVNLRQSANTTRTELTSIPAPSATANGTAVLAAVTSVQLTGNGPESIVRFSGAAGSSPDVAVDTYPDAKDSPGAPLEPGSDMTPISDMTSRSINGLVLGDAGGGSATKADAIALAADTFQPATAADWANNTDMVTDPQQLVVAWRTPFASDRSATINVRIYRWSTATSSFVPFSSTYSVSGKFLPLGVGGVPNGTPQRILSVTTGDVDFDGDPEIVLAYQWGADADVDVDVLSVDVNGDPQSPSVDIRKAAVASFPLQTSYGNTGGPFGVSTIDVATGLFGGHSTRIALGWQTISPQSDDPHAPPGYAEPRVRFLTLPNAQTGRPAKLV